MKRIRKLLFVCIILLSLTMPSCGDKIDLTPRTYKIENFVFHFDRKEDMPKKKNLEKMFYSISHAFEPHLGKEPWKDLCCGPFSKMEIYVTHDKPVTPIRRKEVCGYTFPQDVATIWHEKLLDESCGGWELKLTYMDMLFDDQSEAKDKKWMKENGLLDIDNYSKP